VILCRTGKAEEALRPLRGVMGKLKLTVMLVPLSVDGDDKE
jgi:hypothetical protein